MDDAFHPSSLLTLDSQTHSTATGVECCRRMPTCRFSELQDELVEVLSVIEQQLAAFRNDQATSINVDAADFQTLDDIETQFSSGEPVLAAFAAVAGELIRDSDPVHDVADVRCTLSAMSERFNASRTSIADKRRWLTDVLKRRKQRRKMSAALESWMIDAERRLSETCSSVAFDRFGAEQQLAALSALDR